MTLIELVVVSTIIGLLATVLAAAFVAIVKSNPANADRSDDARSMLGLTTYLPEDINSTPSTGYDFVETTGSGCAGAVDAGVSLVKLTWIELSTTYTANYRLEPGTDGYRIVRHACANGGAGTANTLTSEMPAINESTWNPGDFPAEVTPFVSGTETTGLTLVATTSAGEVFVAEGRTNNPASTLPPAPGGGGPGGPGSTNTPPTATPLSATVPAGVATNVGLNGTDADNDALTATLANVVDTSAAGTWTVVPPSSGLSVTVTPPAGAPDGESITFDFTVDDGRGGTATSSGTITVQAVPNTLPTAGNVSATIDEFATATIIAPIFDADGNTLTVPAPIAPPNLTVTVDSVTSTAVTFKVTSDGTDVSPSFTYKVSDGTAIASATVSLTVMRCTVGSASASPTNQIDRINARPTKLDDNIIVTISYTGPCQNRLTIGYDNNSYTIGAPAAASPTCASGSCTFTFQRDTLDWVLSDGTTNTTADWTLSIVKDGTTEVDSTSVTIKKKS